VGKEISAEREVAASAVVVLLRKRRRSSMALHSVRPDGSVIIRLARTNGARVGENWEKLVWVITRT